MRRLSQLMALQTVLNYICCQLHRAPLPVLCLHGMGDGEEGLDIRLIDKDLWKTGRVCVWGGVGVCR